jgi:hypothetical protein
VPDTALPDGVSLGAALRSAREAAGLSVDEVSAETRIRGTLIRDLEADRFESSGAPVYARGHVKAIAHALGVEDGPYLELFRRQVGGIDDPFPVPAPPPVIPAARGPLAPPEPMHVPTAARPERRGPNWLAAGSAALGVLVVLFAVGQINRSGGSNDDPTLATAITSTPPSATAGPPKPVTVQRPATNDLRVRLLGGDSWVSVRNGAVTLFEGVLRNGATKDFPLANQLRVIVGNAGAVSLACAGHDLAPAGAQGKVRRFTCSRSGITPA